MYNDKMKFTESHEWVRENEDGTAHIGITKHAQELLGDIVYLELPKVGQEITTKQTMGVIESVKAASDLYAPVSGVVIDVNDNVINDPTIINNDPHNDGWMIKITLNNHSELNDLMDIDQYQQMIN